MSDLRRELCLFQGGVVEEALRTIRKHPAVLESRERRGDVRGYPREQVILRPRIHVEPSSGVGPLSTGDLTDVDAAVASVRLKHALLAEDSEDR